jgi:hypothetical protein
MRKFRMRRAFSKMKVLAARYPGLREKVHGMFAEAWSAQAVKEMIENQYGERLGLRSIERYKQQHWQAQHELIREATAALAASEEYAGEARLERSSADPWFGSAALAQSSWLAAAETTQADGSADLLYRSAALEPRIKRMEKPQTLDRRSALPHASAERCPVSGVRCQTPENQCPVSVAHPQKRNSGARFEPSTDTWQLIPGTLSRSAGAP